MLSLHGTEEQREARLASIERAKQRLRLTQAFVDCVPSVKQPRKRQPKPISLDPPRQSGRLASQAKVNYQEDTFAEDRKILSRLSTTGFVMSSHKTPGKTVSEDMSLMDVFKKSPYYEAVDEPVLRLVQECMEAAK